MKEKYFGSEFYSSRLNTFLLFVLIILMVIALCFMFKNKNLYLSGLYGDGNCDIKTTEDITSNINNKNQILGNKDDLISFSIIPGEKVKGPMSYNGVIKGAYFFEANVLINILDGDKKVLKQTNATANGDWMTSGPVGFDGSIDFTELKKGPAYIEIQNDDPSGGEGGPAKKILIPIIIE